MDNCSTPTVALSEQTEPGSCAATYTILRTWRGTDACGNTTSHEQRLGVQDVAAPVLSGVPADATYECDSLPPPGEVTVDDNCTTASVSLIESAEPGDCEGSSTVSRTWTAEDECGNSSNQRQVITLQDTTPPTIENGPANATVECSDVPPPIEVTAVDNCSDPVVTLEEQMEPGPGAGKGIITRTWTAQDNCGNTTTHTQVLNVIDTIAPTLDGVPGDVTVECSAVPTPATVTASDNCASPETQFSETIEQGDCEGKWTIRRTWTATDDCGNTISQTQVITVVDSTPPSFGELPDGLTAECDDVPIPAVVEATDLCSSAPVDFVETSEVGTCSGESTISRTWVARDACGNESRHIQTIQVVDTTAPTMSDDPADVVAECDAVPAPAELSAQDNCTTALDVDYSEIVTPGSCEGRYTLQREWSTADDCGNSVAVNQLVTVQDTTAPTVQLDPDGTQYICDGKPVSFLLDSSDNCSQPALALENLITITANSRDRVNVTEFPDGSVRVTATGPALIMGTATASDDCGNASSPFRFTVTAEKGFEACSQGFWKNHYERWGPTGFSPGDLFLDAFQITDLSSSEIPGDFSTSITLREAINKTGGSFSQLLLQGTAALLSAAHPSVDFPVTLSEVRAIMQATFAGDLAMSDALAWINNGNAAEKECGCPIE